MFKVLTVFLGLWVSFSGLAQAGSEHNAGELAQILQNKVAHVYGPIWATKDAAKIASALLTDDAVITAADSTKVWTGVEQHMELVLELMAAFEEIKVNTIWAAPIGKKGAYQFVEFDLVPAEGDVQKAKSLYVWTKTDNGWRVVADHFSYVGMDRPQGNAP